MKNFALYFLFFLMFEQDSGSLAGYEKEVTRFATEFKKRMNTVFDGDFEPVPNLRFKPDMTANALWDGKEICIGKGFFERTYFTDEDRISIIYHEYNHYLHDIKNLYPCKTDSSGKIYQFLTDIYFEKPICEVEIMLDMQQIADTTLSKQELMLIEAAARKPCIMRLTYAPSNLSREEIACYKAEIEGDTCLKLYKHSHTYRALVEYHINVEKIYLKLRQQYEKEHDMNSDGTFNYHHKKRN